MARSKGGAKGQRGGANVQEQKRRKSASQERPQSTQKNGRQGRSHTPDVDGLSDDDTNGSSRRRSERSPSPPAEKALEMSPQKGRQKRKEKATAASPSEG